MPKPVKKKKKFINKKQATTYRLIPGYVNDEDDAGAKVKETSEEIDSRKEEQRKYGIFYDDSYNYMKHLRSIDEQATLVESFTVKPDCDTASTSSRLPPFVEHFSTDIREEDDIDPDILAALEDAPLVELPVDDMYADVDETDDFLGDNFIATAGGVLPATQDDEEEYNSGSDVTDEEDENTDEQDGEHFSNDASDEIPSDEVDDDDDGDSSLHCIKHRGNLQDDIAEAQTALILKNFEEGLGFRYTSQLPEEDGDMPTIADYENLKQILKEDTEKPMSWSEFLDNAADKPKIDTSKYLYEDEDEYVWTDAPIRKPKFDCMSILSCHSNTKNLPTDILPPGTESKRSQQKSETDENSSVPGMSLAQLKAEMRENRRVDKACTYRPKDETVDERKARKKAIKDERKERRQEKKANKTVFALENEKMKKEAAALSKCVKTIQIS